MSQGRVARPTPEPPRDAGPEPVSRMAALSLSYFFGRP